MDSVITILMVLGTERDDILMLALLPILSYMMDVYGSCYHAVLKTGDAGLAGNG